MARANSKKIETDGAEGDALDLAPLNELAGYLVRMVQLRSFQLFHERFADTKMSPGAFTTLLAIAANPGVRAGSLGDALMIKRSNMSKLLDSLERRGLVRRIASASDKRSMELTLTDRGRAAVESLRPQVLAHEERAFAALTIHERRILLGLLGKLNDGMPRSRS